MNKKRISILVLILLLTIGFAAISTTLVINGTLNVASNTDDYNVYFSAATITTGGTVDGIGSKTLTFSTHTLKTVGETSTVDYTVYNDSTEYDANVTISCVASVESDYFTVTSTFDGNTVTSEESTANILIEAQGTKDGQIVVEQTKAYAEDTDLSVTYTCTINASATSRDIAVTRTTTTATLSYKLPSAWSVTSDNDSDGNVSVGDLITIGTESFYVISIDNSNAKAISQYNLYVGGYYNGTKVTSYGSKSTGEQSSTMVGYNGKNASTSNTWNGVTVYSNTSNDYSTSVVKDYVDDYVDTINALSGQVSEGSLITVEELEALGCSTSSSTCTTSSYAWTYSSSYWTSSAYGTSNLWYVYINGGLDHYVKYNTNNTNFGVRPVLTIPSAE